jgi:small-conductance mechanosensitive channel/CRP-like cAMP-binding protein
MDKYLDVLADTSFAFGGAGVAFVAVLVVLLAILMPREMRGKVRLPALLLLMHVGLFIIHRHTKLQAVRRPVELLGLCALLLCLGRTAFLLVFEWFFRHRLKRPVSRIVADIVQALLYFGVALVIFREMGAEFGSILTTSAVLTAVIGLSLQETLGNLFAGLAIQAQRPFEIGDWVQLGAEDAPARVTEINWRATKLITVDNVEVTIPNGLLAKSAIRNFTKPLPITARIIKVQAPYDVPPHRVEAALIQAAVGCPGVMNEPPPVVMLTQYADNGIEYGLRYSIDDFNLRNRIDSDVRRRVWYSTRRSGIDMPFPVRDVHIRQTHEATAQAHQLEQSRLRLRLIKSVDFLAGLPDAALEQLARTSKLCLYGRDEEMVRQGEPGSDLFIVKSGEAVVTVKQDRSDPIEVARLHRGSIFGEMSLVTGAPRNATVRTESICEVLVIGHDEFASVLEEYPDIAQRISDVLATRQAELEQVQVAESDVDMARHSSELLGRIRRFFSL